jgi:hypothetical protein
VFVEGFNWSILVSKFAIQYVVNLVVTLLFWIWQGCQERSIPVYQADNRLDDQERSIPTTRQTTDLTFQERSIPVYQADNRLEYLCYFPNTLE